MGGWVRGRGTSEVSGVGVGLGQVESPNGYDSPSPTPYEVSDVQKEMWMGSEGPKVTVTVNQQITGSVHKSLR